MVENRVYISNVLQITKNDRNDLKWTKMSSSNLKKMYLKKTCEKKEKKNLHWRVGESNSSLLGARRVSFVLSHRRFDVEMLKINEFIITKSN